VCQKLVFGLISVYNQPMKTITIPLNANDVNSLLESARDEDVLVRAADGTEYILTAIDEFDRELARTRQNAKLMALLDERAGRKETVSLEEVKQRLGLK
jgi:hypothetical protein